MSRQHQCAKQVTSSQEARWKDRCFLGKDNLFIRHEQRHNLHVWIVDIFGYIFQGSKKLCCSLCWRKADPPEPRFQSPPLPNKFQSLSLSVKEAIVMEPNTTPTPLVEKRKKGVGVHESLWTLHTARPKAFPPGRGWRRQTTD